MIFKKVIFKITINTITDLQLILVSKYNKIWDKRVSIKIIIIISNSCIKSVNTLSNISKDINVNLINSAIETARQNNSFIK